MLDVYDEGRRASGLERDHIPNLPSDGSETSALKPSTPRGVTHDVQSHGWHTANMSDQTDSEGVKMEKQGDGSHARIKQQGV